MMRRDVVKTFITNTEILELLMMKQSFSLLLCVCVSPHVCIYNVRINTALLDEATMESIRVKELEGKVIIEQRQKENDKLDIKSYHDKMVTKFKHIFTQNKLYDKAG